MPVLIVYGLPVGTGGHEKLLEDLQHSLKHKKTGGIPSHQISVFFPVDVVQCGLGEELVCFVNGLFEKPERTVKVRQKIAEAIRDVLAGYAFNQMPACTKVEVIVGRFNQDADGFAVWEMPEIER